jgi:transposase-like protein
VEVASAGLAEGWRLAALAEELGVHAVTLRRWVEALPAQGSSLRAVEVIREKDAGIEQAEAGRGLVLVTAAGHRVEGLGLAEVALLLESLE